MSQACLTDYITIDNLQIFLDETTQQDGIALRLWSPKFAQKNGYGWITREWTNACHFHILIRSYTAGRDICYEYFRNKADAILQGTATEWHSVKCPTSLYIFGWPVYGDDGEVLAILFGGLVRGSRDTISTHEWSGLKEQLTKNRALVKELENEFFYAPAFDYLERQELFSKWELFAKLLSKLLTRQDLPRPDDDIWIERLTSFRNCSTIASNLTKIADMRSLPLKLTIIDSASCPTRQDYYQLLITSDVQLDSFGNCSGLPDKFVHKIPVNKKGNVLLSFDENNIKDHGSSFFWEISKNIISGILIHSNSKDLHHRKLLLERQSQIFEKISKKSVTKLETMIEELFNQLRETGVINIDYASFSEVVYFPDDKDVIKPSFKARVVYPKDNWEKSQCDIIEGLDLYTDELINHGSTVYAFQKSRSVLDRDITKSPTYVETQPTVLSSLVMPINYGPLVLGVVAFDSIENDYFNDERKLQLENLTQLISPIVYHNSFQEVLHDLNTNIKNSAQPLTKESKQDIRQHILMALSRLIQAEAASFWEQGGQENTLCRGTSIGNVSGLLDNIEIEKSAIGELFTKKSEHILIPDLQNLVDDHKLRYTQTLIDQGISSFLAFPVSIGGKKVIISFYRFNHPELTNRQFSSVELNITQRLGEILSFYETLNKIFDSQRSELEKQIESREELAITLAHNIKSPLSSTYARLDDMQRKLKSSIGSDFFSEHYDSLFNEISSNFSAIKRSTNVVLKQLSLQEQYLSGLVTAQAFHLYYDILTRQIARVRRGLKIQNEFQRRVVEVSGHKQFPLLYGDKTSVEDMISNLLENAVKYSDEKSKIYIETHFDYVSREIQLFIKNDGKIHILEEDKKRIFEYAYRSKIARDKDPSSTGVGLYYSRYIAERHGATLTVAKLGNPVTFKLVMPVSLLKSAEKAEETLSRKN